MEGPSVDQKVDRWEWKSVVLKDNYWVVKWVDQRENLKAGR